MQVIFNIDDLFAEAEERSIHRADALIRQDSDTLTERSAITESDHLLIAAFLKDAADEVYLLLQTITFSAYPYVYEPKVKILYNVVNEYPGNKLTVLYSSIKSFFVEKMLAGWYRAKGMTELFIEHNHVADQYKKQVNTLRMIDKPKLIYRHL